MKVFVSGATGFIGGHLLRRLMAEGWEVIALVKDKSKLKIQPSQIVEGDLNNNDLLEKSLAGIDLVFHIASIRYEWGFTKEEYFQTNVAGTRNLLTAASYNKVKRFIYCSSVFVSGYNQKLPAKENNHYKISSPYGKSKIEAEKMVLDFCPKNNLPFNVIRPAVTYGPEDKGMLYKICLLVKKKHFMTIGSGNNTLHLCYIDDLIDGIIKAAKSEKHDQIYIIAGKRPVKLNDLLKMISAGLNVRLNGIKIPKLVAVAAGWKLEIWHKLLGIKKEPFVTRNKVSLLTDHQEFSITKAQNELGYLPQTDYNEGIARTIEWYKNHNYL